MLEKEEKLSALFKKTSKIMSEYEKETTGMVAKLHKTRDEQVQVIKVILCACINYLYTLTNTFFIGLWVHRYGFLAGSLFPLFVYFNFTSILLHQILIAALSGSSKFPV